MKMKKVLITWVLLLVMTLNACGADTALLGSWKGNFDVTTMVKEIYTPTLLASDKAMEKYLQLEGMNVELTFTFTEESFSISVDEAAKEALRSSIETALTTTYNAYMEAKASKANMKIDALYAVNATTKEKAIEDFLKGMKVEQVVDVIATAFQVSGDYGYDKESITIVYADDTWEKMKYALKDGQLTITIQNGEQEVPVVCEKTE